MASNDSNAKETDREEPEVGIKRVVTGQLLR